jgi:hypothetical protein
VREVDQALYDHIFGFAQMMAKANTRNFKYSSLYDFFMKEGRLYNPEPYTKAEENRIRKALEFLSHTPAIKQCFYNSQAIALDGGLGYAEGQVLNPDIGLPLEHGFNFLPSGKVVDLTIRPMGEKNTCNVDKLLVRARRNQKNAYFGIPFPASIIRKTWLETHQALMLLGHQPIQELIFEQGYPQEWKKGASWNLGAVPSPWESCGNAFGEIRAEPSPREFFDSLPDFPVEPSPLESGGLRASGENRAEPSLWASGVREGSSGDFRAEPSPLEQGVLGYPSGGFRAEPSRRGISVSGPRPEEEWLDQPEREEHEPDATHSPFEGDIPPWAQRGYAGVFPLGKKVFYITAYVLLGPEEVSREPAPAPEPSPTLGDAVHVANVGDLPSGNFGSDLMYHPFAAIPVRQEDRDGGGEIVDYLVALISELGVYGKILIEDRFPSGDEVRLANGRWFPVYKESRIYGGIDFINAYNTNRFYGGPHEGGWWYDAGDPVASVPIRADDPASKLEWEGYLREKVGWTSQHDTSSVLGHDVFEVRHDDFFARPFPEETPHYE